MPWHYKANILDDFKTDQSWRLFRIISEFTDGFEKLEHIADPKEVLDFMITHRAW